MTKTKRKQPSIEELLERPFCYYCERDFDDLKILINHQKAKHLKCNLCPRRLGTAGGLSVHMQQVHKETLTMIENAIEGREEPGVEIFGMTGIPEEIIKQHNLRVTQEFYAAEANYRERTGNPPPGAIGGPAVKKVKIETAEEIKERLANFKAAKKAGLDIASPATPVQIAESPALSQVESQYRASPPTANLVNSFNNNALAPPPSLSPPVSFPYGPSPVQVHMDNISGHSFNSPRPEGHFGAPMSATAPLYGQQRPPFMTGPPISTPIGYPPGQTPYSAHSNYGPSFIGPGSHTFIPRPSPLSPAPHPMANNPPYINHGRPITQQSPPVHVAPPSASSPAMSTSSRPPNLSFPQAPGLPPRPSFDAPQVSRQQLEGLHIGQKVVGANIKNNSPMTNLESSSLASSVDDLIASAQQNIQSAQVAAANNVKTDTAKPQIISNQSAMGNEEHSKPTVESQQNDRVTGDAVMSEVLKPKAITTLVGDQNVAREGSVEGTSKSASIKGEKTKKRVILVVGDTETSPEQKMARLARYSVTPRRTTVMA